MSMLNVEKQGKIKRIIKDLCNDCSKFYAGQSSIFEDDSGSSINPNLIVLYLQQYMEFFPLVSQNISLPGPEEITKLTGYLKTSLQSVPQEFKNKHGVLLIIKKFKESILDGLSPEVKQEIACELEGIKTKLKTIPEELLESLLGARLKDQVDEISGDKPLVEKLVFN